MGTDYIDMSEISIRKPNSWDYRAAMRYGKERYYMLMKKIYPNIIIQIISSNNGTLGMTNRIEVKRLLIQSFYGNISELSNDQIANMTLNVLSIDVMDNPYRKDVQKFIKNIINQYNR